MFFSRKNRRMSWPTRLFASRRPAAQKRRTVRFGQGLMLEGLEDRKVMTYLAPASYAVGTNPGGVTIGDFNRDSIPDMAVANSGLAGTVRIFQGTGGGAFNLGVDYSAGSYANDTKAGDFDGDGSLDLAVVGSNSTLTILRNNGDGTFAAPVTYVAGVGSHSINVGDFNNDGKLDVVTMNSTTTSLFLGNGDGTLQAHSDTFIPGNSTNTVVGDFNNDGSLDVATSNTASVGTITVLRGHGDGSFDPASSYPAYSAPVYLASGDYNEDGYDDFCVANSYAASAMSVVLSNGDGTYAPPKTYNIKQTGFEIESGDFNHDGHDDFAVRGSSQYMVQYGKGNGSFYPLVSYSVPTGRFEMGSSGDIDGDGAVDFAYPSTSGVTIVRNANDDVTNVAGAVSFQVDVPASATAGAGVPMTVTALDASGNVATGFLGTVYVTSNDPGSVSTFAYTFTAADAGVHAFGGTVRFATLGDQTLTVSAPFLAATTRTVTVTPAVSRFSVSAPTVSAAGDSFSVTVTALDSLGSVGTGYGGTIRFSSSDAQAGLPANYTFTTDDAGSHTFTVSLRSAGSRYVGVNEVGGTVAGGAFVNVTAGVASSFTLAGGAGAIGFARPVTVIARDAYGNTDTSYNGTVHVTSSDANAILPADVSLVNGSATFNVTLMTVGTQTITATDVANPAVTGSVSSDATPPIAKFFTVSGYPTSVAGTANSFTVRVIDSIGQAATGYTGTIYFSSSDVQAGLPSSYTFTAADAGSHAFSATLKTAGVQSITARDATGTLLGSQVGISVTPAAFASFRLSVPFGTDSKGHILMTAGDTIPLTVRATDAFGNLVVGYKGKVHVTSTDTQAALPSDYNFTTTDAGVHTFNVALKTATVNGAVASFSVADTSSATTLTTITNFEVVNAAAAKFVFNTPSNATIGTAFTVKVTAVDAYGNKVKNYFGTVHFSSTAASTGLPADYTFTPDDAGSHTFDVILTTGVDQTLTVIDTLTPSLTASGLIKVKSASGGGGGGGGGGGKKV